MTAIASVRIKLSLLIIGCIACFAVITARLYLLQITQHHYFLTLCTKNYTRMEPILSQRGSITDINGVLLATNRPVVDLYWHGTHKRRLSDQQNLVLDSIDTILTEPLSDDLKTQIAICERFGRKLLLARDLSFEQLSQVVEQFPNHPNLDLPTQFTRLYPNGPLASHIVGFLGNIRYEDVGKMGLEKLCEQDLRGEDGLLKKKINSVGKSLEQAQIKQAASGMTLQTTLDFEMQKIAELIFPAESAGVFIIMDPKTGAIKALVSRPTFDPNIFLKTVDMQSWQELLEKKALLNRAFDACYPPASIFKLVTTSAALEQGFIEPDDIVYCKGYYEFGGYRHWCVRHTGHGSLSVQEALAESCNILFYHIGKHINIDTLADYARRFGLGKKTNVLFPEKTGLIPDRQWKQQTRHERWWQGETLSTAIGQGFLLVTPIQIIRMIASIFEGYLVKPRILESEIIEKEPLRISKKTREFLQQGMRSAVTEGTGRRLNKLKDIEVYAKTGTAQVSSLKFRTLGTNLLEHAWFVAHCRIKEEQPFVLVALLEHAGNSRPATITAKNFLLEYRKLINSRTLSNG
ncbi:penicillin-binding protein 2 [Candidatus Babeliales bacterium]|nr:penicillin-binding protein 2 [Candidatus Babeliales bacterium]